MADTFYVSDLLREIVTIREIMKRRRQKLLEVGGIPTVTEGHIAALDALEGLLCGTAHLPRWSRICTT